MRRNLLLLATTLVVLAGPAQAQTAQTVTLDSSKPMVAKTGSEQKFFDTVDLKPGQDRLPLTLSFTNTGYKWMRIYISGRQIATERDFKGTSLVLPANDFLSAGANQFQVVAGGDVDANLAWTLTAPRVTVASTAPKDANIGQSLTIKGSNFSTTGSDDVVTFKSGEQLPVSQASSTSLTVTIPDKVKPGDNQLIVTRGGISSTPLKIKVKGGPPPTLSDIEGGYGGPILQGFAGMAVTINGNNFGDSGAKVKVFFGDSEVAVTSHSQTQITVNLPDGQYGPAIAVSVSVNNIKSTNSLSINLLHQNRVW